MGVTSTACGQGLERDRFRFPGQPRKAGRKPARIAIPVAADDQRDREIGMNWSMTPGFDGLDAGTLAESWRQQPGTPCYCSDLTSGEMPGALAATDAARAPIRRDLAVAAIQERVGDPTTNPGPEWGVRLSRVMVM
ncbi:hypothetical protein [Pseudonocardia sediminis]|uniref:hypothetical protein n=1 Tax=Pseudonocardia sediminis TaxID=1397368 RepID=UPI001A93A5FE|nr:hypothetical protein [Pseudonocardia sediminis]